MAKCCCTYAGGLAGLLPQASQLQSQLQAGAGRPAFGWYQQPRQAPQGPSARWVAEADLPLWLVRGQEERARREAAMAAAEAQQKAARVSPLQYASRIPQHTWIWACNATAGLSAEATAMADSLRQPATCLPESVCTMPKLPDCRKRERPLDQAQPLLWLQSCVRCAEEVRAKV